MVILPSTRTETAAVTSTPGDPRCVAIANRYGEADHLYMEIINAEPKAETPSMVMVMATYGTDAVLRQLQARIRIAVLRMDESALNDEEVESIAQAIVDEESARILGYDLVMGFFTALEHGKYSLYNFKPRHVMEAWHKYAESAIRTQGKLKRAAENARNDAEWEEHRKQCITFEEYKRRKQQHSEM